MEKPAWSPGNIPFYTVQAVIDAEVKAFKKEAEELNIKFD